MAQRIRITLSGAVNRTIANNHYPTARRHRFYPGPPTPLGKIQRDFPLAA
jgi:hypothetical protein